MAVVVLEAQTAQIVVSGLQFFLGDFYRFWESNAHNVYVELIELICLSSLFTVSDALAPVGKCSVGKVSGAGALGEA